MTTHSFSKPTMAGSFYARRDELLSLRNSTDAITTSTLTVTNTGVAFPAKQFLEFGVIIDQTAYTNTTHSVTINVQAATASGTSTTGTTLASIVLPAAAGQRKIAITGQQVQSLVSSTADLFIRAQSVAAGTQTGTYNYSAYLTETDTGAVHSSMYGM